MLYIAELCCGQVVKDLLWMLEQPYLSKNFANHVILLLLDIVRESKSQVKQVKNLSFIKFYISVECKI